jgi:hypothetical protein
MPAAAQFHVRPGLEPGIHRFTKKMDCRVEPGNDV